MEMPRVIESEEQLEALLSAPSAELTEMFKRLVGDLMILGIAGKMGMTMGRRAVNAIRQAGVAKRVIGVSRFSSPESRAKLEAWGIETIPCDLLNPEAVAALPKVANIIFMAGRKFGTGGSEETTWAMNTLAPGYAADHFRESRIVVFSTGCVYPLTDAASGGCTEAEVPAPVGEYSQSCLGRERIFQYAAKNYGTRVLLFRLNYAIDLRYGVLHDIASKIMAGEAIDLDVGHFNAIWQGDANDYALRSLELAEAPAAVLNVTGPETASVAFAARRMAAAMGKSVRFSGTPGERCYLSNSGKMAACFGYPSVAFDTLLAWQADWMSRGGATLGKPTHFEVSDGKF